jgi:hypothetical protein
VRENQGAARHADISPIAILQLPRRSLKESYIYILSNKNRTVFYTGITADLSQRMEFHLEGKRRSKGGEERRRLSLFLIRTQS